MAIVADLCLHVDSSIYISKFLTFGALGQTNQCQDSKGAELRQLHCLILLPNVALRCSEPRSLDARLCESR